LSESANGDKYSGSDQKGETGENAELRSTKEKQRQNLETEKQKQKIETETDSLKRFNESESVSSDMAPGGQSGKSPVN